MVNATPEPKPADPKRQVELPKTVPLPGLANWREEQEAAATAEEAAWQKRLADFEAARAKAEAEGKEAPKAPATSDAKTATVQAVGTSFDVERAPGGVRVTVVEGRVAVTQHETGAVGRVPAPTAAPARVMLGANEEIVVPSQAPMKAAVHEVNAPAQAAWTTGLLVFEDETVAEVVRRFNLHNQAQIRILAPELAERRISGTFRASDPESFIAFIHATSASPASDRSVILVEPHSR